MSQIKQLHEVGGLMSCLFSHEVQKSTASFKWDGPALSREVWNQVLAFFRWTNAEHHSESQVRLFVNHRLQVWAAHAFPQEARTGMSTKELDIPDAALQRARFSDTDGWLYWGTAHHHCSGGAFQSGTDLNNERNQDGLHITVGKIDQAVHDLHCRLYIAGFELTPHLDWFWDVGDVGLAIPVCVRALLPDNWRHELAKRQMCEAPPADTAFPDEWKSNVIEIKTEPPSSDWKWKGGLGYCSGSSFNSTPASNYRKVWSLPRDVMLAAKEFEELLDQQYAEPDSPWDPIAALDLVNEQDLALPLIEILQRNDVTFESLYDYFEEEQEHKEIQQELGKQQTGVPDYEGHQGLPE